MLKKYIYLGKARSRIIPNVHYRERIDVEPGHIFEGHSPRGKDMFLLDDTLIERLQSKLESEKNKRKSLEDRHKEQKKVAEKKHKEALASLKERFDKKVELVDANIAKEEEYLSIVTKELKPKKKENKKKDS